MPTIPVFLSEDLHKKFRLKLYKDDMTAKEFFLSAVQKYVNPGDQKKIEDVEKPKNSDTPIKVRHVTDIVEREEKDIGSEEENTGPKEKIENGKKTKKTRTRTRAGTGDRGTKKRKSKKDPSGLSGEKGEGDQRGPGPRKKRGLWPWVR